MKKSYLKYNLDDRAYIILSLDERDLEPSRKYYQSPFPLLTNLERFSNTVGGWNTELQEYGIQCRLKFGDQPKPFGVEFNVGTLIHLAYYGTLSSRGNRYLKTQYKRLESYRSSGSVSSYWSLSWALMRGNWFFRTACIGNWERRWYKKYSTFELKRIWKGLNRILNLETLQTVITNVWIESPKGKWRQLGVPPKSWRLYFHMLNMFVSYIFEPTLNPREYDGFIYNRGCKSWWESVLWSNVLNDFSSVIEVDISSGFPNLTRESVKTALFESGLVPTHILNLILTHLSSPLKESKWFPNVETFIENAMNLSWRKSNRSVHMGIGISPILFVITLDWALKKSKIKNPHLIYKFYADDGSFYFNLRGLYNLMTIHDKDVLWAILEILSGQNVLVSILNDLPVFQFSGLQFCSKKSRLVKLLGIWVNPFISLGLNLYTPLSLTQQLYLHLIDEAERVTLELSGWTRGRGENPVTGRPGTEPSRISLSFENSTKTSQLNLTLMKRFYKRYFGLILSRLYGSELTPPKVYSGLGSQAKYGSLLGTLIHVPRKSRLVDLKLDIFNSGGKLTEEFLQANMNQRISSDWNLYKPNLQRELKIEWKRPPLDWSPLANIDPLKLKEESSDLNYFRKFTELNLDPETYLKFQTLYSCSDKNRNR